MLTSFEGTREDVSGCLMSVVRCAATKRILHLNWHPDVSCDVCTDTHTKCERAGSQRCWAKPPPAGMVSWRWLGRLSALFVLAAAERPLASWMTDYTQRDVVWPGTAQRGNRARQDASRLH